LVVAVIFGSVVIVVWIVNFLVGLGVVGVIVVVMFGIHVLS
jgi:hypothetical protein